MRMRKKKWALPELASCPFYVENPKEFKGKWKNQFKDENLPLHVELGCGKGLFLYGQALKMKDTNFLGLDISPDVLACASRNIKQAFFEQKCDVDNVLMMIESAENLDEILSLDDKVEAFYINFPVPWPKARHHKRRLTSVFMLEKMKRLLIDGGKVYFRSDNLPLYLFSKRTFLEAGYKILYQSDNIHEDENSHFPLITTEHEKMFMQQNIPIKAIIATPNKS